MLKLTFKAIVRRAGAIGGFYWQSFLPVAYDPTDATIGDYRDVWQERFGDAWETQSSVILDIVECDEPCDAVCLPRGKRDVALFAVTFHGLEWIRDKLAPIDGAYMLPHGSRVGIVIPRTAIGSVGDSGYREKILLAGYCPPELA